MKPDPDNVICWPAVPLPGESAERTSPEVAFDRGAEGSVVAGSVVPGSVVEELAAAPGALEPGFGELGAPCGISCGEWELSAIARPAAVSTAAAIRAIGAKRR